MLNAIARTNNLNENVGMNNDDDHDDDETMSNKNVLIFGFVFFHFVSFRSIRRVLSIIVYQRRAEQMMDKINMERKPTTI